MQPPDELRDPSRASGWLNKLLSFVKSNQLVEGVGYRLLRTTRGTALEIQAGGGGGGSPGKLRRYLVNAVEADHLVCDDGVIVAKPWRLQRTPFDGNAIVFEDERSRTYTASYQYSSHILRKVRIGVVEEFQVVVPRYKLGFDYIFASESENGTGVTGATLVDVNADGRAWARER